MLMMNDSIRDAVLERRTSHALRKTCFTSHEFMTLLEDGLLKAAKGITTISEVLRCLPRLQQVRPLTTLRRIAGE
jgi:type IV pilus assembly protein PilB